jgi:hypothetical protein
VAKKVTVAQPRPVPTADDWVTQKTEPKPEAQPALIKRITVDVSEVLHTRIKVGCAAARVKMADAVREVLERSWPATKDREAA